MATREEYERRFMAAVTDANEVINCTPEYTTSQWSPRLACEALAREVAAALGEMQAERQTTGPDKGPTVVVIPRSDTRSDVEKLSDPAPMPEWKPATPPASEPTGEVMTELKAVAAYLRGEVDMVRSQDGGWLWRPDVFEATIADQRTAVEAACAPLREEIARLEKLRDELAKAAAGYKMLYEGSLDETFKRMCDKSEAEKRIAALEAELAEARKAGAK